MLSYYSGKKKKGMKEITVLLTYILDTFYLRVFDVGYTEKNNSARKENRCHRFMGYTFD